jgi:hypothetical protein
MKMKRKDSANFDHTNIMGLMFSLVIWGFVCLLMTIAAVSLFGAWFWFTFPIAIAIWAANTWVYLNAEVEGNQL